MPKKLTPEEQANMTALEKFKAMPKTPTAPAARAPTPPASPAALPTPEIIRDEATGKITGVKLPDGRVVLGSQQDINDIIARQTPQPTPAGTMEATQAGFQREQAQFVQKRQESALDAIKNPPQAPTQALTPSPLNIGTAITSGVVGAGIGAVGGMLTGNPVGVALGAVTGAVQQIRSNLGGQIAEEIAASKTSLKTLRALQQDTINSINRGDDPTYHVQNFYALRDKIVQSYGQTKLDQQSWLAKATGKDATKALEDYENYFTYTFPNLENDLNMAVLNPNLNRIRITTAPETA